MKKTRVVMAVILLFVPSALFGEAAERNKIVRAGPDRIANEYIVVFADDVKPEQASDLARQLTTAHGGRVEKVWHHAIKGFFAVLPEAAAEALSRNPRIQSVEENAPWYLSAQQQTNIDPAVCDPTAGTCPTVTDDRLWHLDRADQNYASPDNICKYCTDGTGKTVYVVDSGVNRFHNEFGPTGSRVLTGYNATGDFMPANDPCMGFALQPAGLYAYLEEGLYNAEILASGHGTAVASALGGNRVGVAKSVTIVPIKVFRCDKYSARTRISNHYYQQNETIARPDSGGVSLPEHLYRALNSGYTAAADPGSWPTTGGATRVDGGVTWEVVPPSQWQNVATTAMLIDGLNWILTPANPGPKSNAVVTLSTYRLATDPNVAGPSGTVEAAIRSLLANNITVVASANNQNGNACHTSPGRMSINNPDSSVANEVITAGGSMILNRPWSVDISDLSGTGAIVADGPKPDATYYGVEPAYNATQGVRDGRWICGAGDSSIVCNNTTPTMTPNPAFASTYYNFQGGSNAGPCVTLFAPAKNLFVASVNAANGYRDGRVRGGHASGTSWSAPIVAGVAARILQSNPAYTPAQIRQALLDNSESVLDPATLNTVDHNGLPIANTPNKLLKLSDVNITAHPQSTVGSPSGTPLTVTASATSAVSFQWFEVNAGFDYGTYNRGAHSSTAVTGVLTPGILNHTFTAPASAQTKAYWVRVTNSCGTADSNIAVVTACPSLSITALSPSVSITSGAGTTVELRVTASSSSAISYQWYSGAAPNTGAPLGTTQSIFVSPSVTSNYWVRVSTACASVDSATITVTLVPPSSTSASFYTVTPCRLIDTREPVGPYGGPALNANTARTIQVTGICGIPSGAKAIAFTATAIGAGANGWLTAYPAGAPLPASSILNYRPGKNRAGNGIVSLSSGGAMNVYNGVLGSTPIHFVIDIVGYFQ